MKQLPELDQRLAQMERIFHAPSLTPELIAAIKLISPHCDLAPRERHRLVWEADQNGACWGEYEALEPFLSRIPTDAKILEIGPGMGRSLVFFAKKLGWHGNQLHAYEGNGDTTKYTLLGPRFEDSFCGNIAELQHILDFNGLHDVTIFDAKKINLASLPGRPYDLIYSFYSIGFHWSLEHFLNDLMLLLGEAGIAIFTTTANFEPFDSLRQLSYRLVDWKPAWPKDAILKFIVLSKTPLRGDPTPQPSGIRRISRNSEMAEIFPRSHNAERESGTAAWAQTQNYLGNEMVKIAVVTPYYKENDDVLRQCHLSVVRQSYPCTHILVADGHPKSQFDNEPRTMHITLPQANGDVGNTARAIGGILADAYGFDAVAYSY